MSHSITTVRGEIQPSSLGITSMHDHLNADMELVAAIAKEFSPQLPPPQMLTLENRNLAFLRSGAAIFSDEARTAGDVDYTAAELSFFKSVGGNAVVDPSPIGIRGDVRDLRAASERADVHVITATGLYTARQRPAGFHGWTEDQQVEFFRREIVDGIDGTDIRAGILKCALSADRPAAPLNEAEVTTLRSCARVAIETGVSMHVHSAYPMTADSVLAGVSLILDEMNLDPGRLVMMHMDSFLRSWDSRNAYIQSIESVKTIDVSLHERVLDRGVTIGFDTWGTNVEVLPQDDDRLKGLVHLIRKGYDGQIVLGHDSTDKSQGMSYGGYGYTWFTQLVGRSLPQFGIDPAVFGRLAVENPARVLAYDTSVR